MEAYHGTSAGVFDSFSLGHALEGDGKVKFGWGVYVTEKYGTAAHYAGLKSQGLTPIHRRSLLQNLDEH